MHLPIHPSSTRLYPKTLYLSIRLSIHRSSNPSSQSHIHFIHQPIHPYIHPSINQSIHLSSHTSIYPSFHPSHARPSIHPLPIHPSINPSIHPSPTHPSIHPNFHPSITHKFIHPSTYPSSQPHINLSIIPSIHPSSQPASQPPIYLSIHASITHPSMYSPLTPFFNPSFHNVSPVTCLVLTFRPGNKLLITSGTRPEEGKYFFINNMLAHLAKNRNITGFSRVVLLFVYISCACLYTLKVQAHCPGTHISLGYMCKAVS